MSKLCNRNYDGNSLLSAEVVNGVELCTLCKKPTACHGKPVEQRALNWALSGDTGISSEAIAAHMTGSRSGRMQPPSDSSDRGRCIRLLELIPEWIPRLPEMLQYDQHHRDESVITISNSGISADRNTWQQQIPLIMQEGRL